DPKKLEKLAGTPFNCILDYGMTARPVEEIRAYLDAAETCGIKVIFCVNDVYPSATHRQRLGDWVGNDAIIRGIVTTFRDHPALIAWYNNDELPIEKVPEIEGYYRTIRELDPGHPQLIVHYKRGSWGAFIDAADVIGVDNYPIPGNPVTAVADALAAARDEIGGKKPVWAVLQDFAWYQHRDVVQPVVPGDRSTPRARIPAPAEWEKGRPPTLDEVRAMSYLSLIEGAKGILYWCLYNLDYLPDRAERWADALRVAKEIEALAPVLLDTAGQPVKTSDPGVRAILKRHGGRRYLIAVNGTAKPLRVTFEFDRQPERATVLFEERTVQAFQGKLVDFFPPLGRHVYVIDEEGGRRPR
ncbi:MAG: hypothetical protein JXP34_19300, partial [Planctomycetes bacterium]|nr:hypothetical protein [Planctomycetota bacterium]